MRLLALLLLVSVVATTGVAIAKPTAEADLKAIDDKFVEAFNKKDIESIIALYAEDATAMFPGPDLWHKGRAAIRQSFVDFFADCQTPMLVVHDATYRVKGDIGYGFGLYDMSYKDAKTGEMVTMKGRALSVMEKRGGKWVYVVDHASVPMPEGQEEGAMDPASAPQKY